MRILIRRSEWFCLTAALFLLLAPVVRADPAEAGPAPRLFEVDWEASANLVFFAVPDELLVPGENKARVRITQGESLWFSERVAFDPGNAEPPVISTKGMEADFGMMSFEPKFVYALELLARNPAEIAELLDAVRAGGDFRAEIRLNGHLLFRGSMQDLVAESDELRSGVLFPLTTTSKLVDRRPAERRGGQLQEKVTCEGLCEINRQECVEQACGPEVIICEECDDEYFQCVADCQPDPVCTPGLISTNTYSEIVSAQFAGSSCFYGVFNYGDLYNRYYLTVKYTTYHTYRAADCSTYTVFGGVSYASDYCYNNTFIPCSFPFGFPFCTFF